MMARHAPPDAVLSRPLLPASPGEPLARGNRGAGLGPPFHDWNERVTAECYGPNGAARIESPADRIVDIVNSYARSRSTSARRCSPGSSATDPTSTPASWRPTRRAWRGAGTGNAIAQGYNHAILPLCSPQDRRTQIEVGAARLPAPASVARPRASGCRDRRGRADALGAGRGRRALHHPLAVPGGPGPAAGRRLERRHRRALRPDPALPRAGRRQVDGGLLLRRKHRPRARLRCRALLPGRAARRLQAGYDDKRDHPELLAIAVDGETLGHHKKGADEALAEALRRLGRRDEVELLNFGQALERLPVEWEAEIAEPSSWSCAHGVERWRSDCGCQDGGRPGWRQAWRAPLREALDGLRDRLGDLYAREASPLLRDPSAARDRYVELVLDPAARRATSGSCERRGATSSRRSGARRCSCSRCSARRCSCTRAAAGSSPSSPAWRRCRS